MRSLLVLAFLSLSTASDLCPGGAVSCSENEGDEIGLLSISSVKQRSAELARSGDLAHGLPVFNLATFSQSKSSRLSFLNSFSDHIVNLMKEGNVDKDVVDFINDMLEMLEIQIFPIFEREHDVDQLLLHQLWLPFAGLTDILEDAVEEIEQLNSNVDTHSEYHLECRALEKIARDNHEACLEIQELKRIDWENKEKDFMTHLDNIDAMLCPADIATKESDSFRTNLQNAFNTYAGNLIAVRAAKQAWEDQQVICRQLRFLLEGNTSICNGDQRSLEEVACMSWRKTRQLTASYEEPFQDAIDAYNAAVTTIKVEEKDRKVEYTVLKKVNCLLEKLIPTDDVNGSLNTTSNLESIEACHVLDVDTSNLTIVYNTTPDIGDVPEERPSPCDSEWTHAQYPADKKYIYLPCFKCIGDDTEPGQWSLAYNVDPGDGHASGYLGAGAAQGHQSYWDDGHSRGSGPYMDPISARLRLHHDFKNMTVLEETSKFITIARHNATSCEAYKSWRFTTEGSLISKIRGTVRTQITMGGPVHQKVSPDLPMIEYDPIFGVAGDLFINYVFCENRGARFVLDGQLLHGTGNCAPGLDDMAHGTRGLAMDNDLESMTTHPGCVSPCEHYDVGALHADVPLGTDENLKVDGIPFESQYAIYVASGEKMPSFHCKAGWIPGDNPIVIR